MTETVYLAVYDTLADWETGYAIAAINRPLWHKDPGRFEVRTVGPSTEPVTTIGGMRVLPDLTIDDLAPSDAAMLILPGNNLFATPAYVPFTDKARELLDAGVPVAGICGATGGLARAGLLNEREHTSNAKEYLAGFEGSGYTGGALYRDEPAVIDRDLITGTAHQPVDFARLILQRLGIYEPSVLESWYKLYGLQDGAGYFELVAGAQ